MKWVIRVYEDFVGMIFLRAQIFKSAKNAGINFLFPKSTVPNPGRGGRGGWIDLTWS